MKRLFKMLFCRHDYHLYGIVTWGGREYERKEIVCRCEKCGKEKSIIFQKPVDKFKKL